MKVSIIVLTHNQERLLEQFISNFPPPVFDFIVFVDKKVSITPFHSLLARFSHVRFVEKRHPVFWCGHSTLQAILRLLETWAQTETRSDWVFFTSGTCFPLKNSTQFLVDLQALEVQHLVSIEGDTVGNPEKSGFLSKWYFYNNHLLSRPTQPLLPMSIPRRATRRIASKIAEAMASRLPDKTHADLLFGSSWWGVRREAAEFIIEYTARYPQLYNNLKYSNCPEEFYIQNVLRYGGYVTEDYLSLQRDAMTQRKIYGSHFIDWGGGGRDSPLVLDADDFGELIASGAFFCRKIVEGRSDGLIGKLIKHLST